MGLTDGGQASVLVYAVIALTWIGLLDTLLGYAQKPAQAQIGLRSFKGGRDRQSSESRLVQAGPTRPCKYVGVFVGVKQVGISR